MSTRDLSTEAVRTELQKPRVVLTVQGFSSMVSVDIPQGLHLVLTNDAGGRTAPLMSLRMASCSSRSAFVFPPPQGAPCWVCFVCPRDCRLYVWLVDVGTRPYPSGGWSAAGCAVTVDVFNSFNTEWEPLVELWHPQFMFAAIDHGDTSIVAPAPDVVTDMQVVGPPGLGAVRPIRHVVVMGDVLNVNFTNSHILTFITAYTSMCAALERHEASTDDEDDKFAGGDKHAGTPPPEETPGVGAGGALGARDVKADPAMTDGHSRPIPRGSQVSGAYSPYVLRNLCGTTLSFQPIASWSRSSPVVHVVESGHGVCCWWLCVSV